MSEYITKPEVTEKYVRIPVSARQPGDRIRTITISASQGIKALYAGNRKKVLTYLFARSKGWTMAKAKAWVKSHRKSVEESIMAELETKRFQFEIPLIKAREKVTKDKTGKEKTERFVEGIASSTNLDLHGDRMAPSAIESMADSLKQHVIMLNAEHDKSWQSELGEIITLDAVEKGKNYDLILEAKLDEMSKSHDLWYALTEKNKKLGLSIGGYVKEFEMERIGDDEDGYPKWRRIFKEIELDHVAVTSSPANPKAWVSAIEKSLESPINEMKERVMKMSEEKKRDVVLKLIEGKAYEEINMILDGEPSERTDMGTSPLKTEKEEKDKVEETKTATDDSESSESVASENGDGEQDPKETDKPAEEDKPEEGEDSKEEESEESKESESESEEESAEEDKESSKEGEESDDDKGSEESTDKKPAEEAEEDSEDTDSKASEKESDDTKEASENSASVAAQLRKIAEGIEGSKEESTKEVEKTTIKIVKDISKNVEAVVKFQEGLNESFDKLTKRVVSLEDQPVGRKTTAVDKGIGTDESAPEKALEEALAEADKKYVNHPNLFSIKQRIRQEYKEKGWA